MKQQKTSGNGGPDEEREVRLRVLRDLAGCLGSLYLWKYDSNLKLQESSSSAPRYWNDVFLFTECSEEARAHCSRSDRPVLLSSPYGLQWIACPYRETEGSCSIYVLGPLFLSEYSQHKMERSLEYRDVSVELKLQLLEQLKKIPSIAMEMVVYLGVMLQFCLTGEKISPQEIVFRKLQTADAGAEEDEAEDLLPGPHGGAEYEQMMLKAIEEGNMDFQGLLAGFQYGRVGTLAPGDALRQFQDLIITSITLCSRAAIRGGLSRETALTLSDYYIQAVEAARTVSEVGGIQAAMRNDYTSRVHRLKEMDLQTSAVRRCKDVIDRNITNRLTITEIARQTGYAGYYISSLFHKETGMSVNDYIKQQKISYAKTMLLSSDQDVAELAAKLHFSSPSYFSAVFRQLTGLSPREFRQRGTEKPPSDA